MKSNNRQGSKAKGNRDAEETEDSENLKSQSIGDPQEMDVSKDLPPLATRIRTFQEAVSITLETTPQEADLIFTFCRALRALEVTLDRTLSRREREGAFSLLWAKAKDRFPAGADSDEYRLFFLVTFPKVRSPLGSDHLEEAVRRSATFQPPAATLYSSPKLKQLVAICYHLQVLSEESPFFLSVRSVMARLCLKSPRQASDFLNGLVLEGILEIEEKGIPGGKRASRFRYVAGKQERSRT